METIFDKDIRVAEEPVEPGNFPQDGVIYRVFDSPDFDPLKPETYLEQITQHEAKVIDIGEATREGGQ